MDLKFLVSIFNDYLQYIHFFFTSVIFGLASFLQKVLNNESQKTFYHFFSEIVFSLCAGYLAFRLSLYANFQQDLMWIMVAIASWSGTKFLTFAENLQKSILKKKFEIVVTNEDDNDNNKTHKYNSKNEEDEENISKNRFENEDHSKNEDAKIKTKFRPKYNKSE